MPKFEVRQTAKLDLTSYSGLALIGQCFDVAQVDKVIDSRLPVSQGMKTSDMVNAMTGLLKETLNKCLCGRIAALRGARLLAYLLDMSRCLRAVRLAFHPA